MRVQKKGWMVADLMQDWLYTVWEKKTWSLSTERAIPNIGQLLGAFCWSCVTKDEDLKGRSCHYPCIDICPPAIKCLNNKPFKHHIQLSYSDWTAASSHWSMLYRNIMRKECSYASKYGEKTFITDLKGFWDTNSTEQHPSWEADSHWSGQEIPHLSWN